MSAAGIGDHNQGVGINEEKMEGPGFVAPLIWPLKRGRGMADRWSFNQSQCCSSQVDAIFVHSCSCFAIHDKPRSVSLQLGEGEYKLGVQLLQIYSAQLNCQMAISYPFT